MKAVLLPTVAEQLAARDWAGDSDIIDPAGLQFDDHDTFPVFEGFDFNVSSIVGNATNLHVEDGRLVADIRLMEGKQADRFSVAGIQAPGEPMRLIAVGAVKP